MRLTARFTPARPENTALARGTTVRPVSAMRPLCMALVYEEARHHRQDHGPQHHVPRVDRDALELERRQRRLAAGAGRGITLGLPSFSGTGSSAPSNSCDPISGTGVLKGAAGTLQLKLTTTSKGCATDQAAPISVAVTGSATVISGTGKFVGTTGTLKVTGSFSINSTTVCSSESDPFSATLSGSLKAK